MNLKNKPIIMIMTSRVGSTVLAGILSNYLMQCRNYGTSLYEFFTKERYKKDSNTLYSTIPHIIDDEIRIIETNYQNMSYYDFVLSRLEFLKKSKKFNLRNQLIKLNCTVYVPELIEYLKNEYQIIFVERKNIINQHLSWYYMKKTKTTHYTHSNNRILNFYYNNDGKTDNERQPATLTIKMLEIYDRYKIELKQQSIATIYYEDFVQDILSMNQIEYLRKILNFDVISDFKEYDIETVATPYSDNIENLIINKQDWIADKILLEEFQRHRNNH